MMDIRCKIVPLMLLGLVFFLAGCQRSLQGRVVAGPESSIAVVNQDDPRLTDGYNGINLAKVALTLDPETMKPLDQGSTYAQSGGSFSLPISAQGAGLLMYDALVTAECEGYKPVQRILPLPGQNQRLLITLAPGEGKLSRPTNFLEETFEMGKPYLNEKK
ncbi:hypothetical protein [Poriferisphaera sp. WC338]|uniref:hypothetical protein n=1 Tax=Poriferisphaera sp. WC338 TaxID=3425129 RepID=UPI003D81751B